MAQVAASLQAALEAQGIAPKLDATTGQVVWLQARYDSPWVPADKRTNEVLLELEPEAAVDTAQWTKPRL